MTYVSVCKVSELAEGAITSVSTKKGLVAITKLNGKVCAFENRCSHDDEAFDDGSIEGEEIVCPRHGARFHIPTGEVRRMPATDDIEVFPVKINGDTVEVDVDAND